MQDILQAVIRKEKGRFDVANGFQTSKCATSMLRVLTFNALFVT